MELTNNSNEMKTVVETFIEEETSTLIYDNDKLDHWNKMVKDLGLKGQGNVVQKDKSPIPFMFIKDTLKATFETLCPRKVNVEDYDITPIPVEILDLIALSKKESYFSKIEIWYDDKEPDPLCIGVVEHWILHEKGKWSQVGDESFRSRAETEAYIKENNRTDLEPYDYTHTRGKRYLLGKWADVKHSFEELKKRAKKRWLESEKQSIQSSIRDQQRRLEDLESQAFNRFG